MRTFYHGAVLFTAATAAALPDGALLVDGARIVRSGARADVEREVLPADRRVDLGGRFLMPGMVDAHTHSQYPSWAPGGWPLALVERLEVATIRATRNLKAYLASGFTTVMEVGCRGNISVALRDAVASGLLRGPRIIASGNIISPTGGLGDQEPGHLHNEFPYGVTADSPAEWRKLIRQQIRDGVDNVKIGVSGSSNNPNSDPRISLMSEDEIRVVTGEAHLHGRTVAAHAHPPEAVRAAVRADVDTLHHAFYLDAPTIEELVRGRSYFVPTSNKMRSMVEMGTRAGRLSSALEHYRQVIPGYMEALAYAIDAGLADRIALGSDASNTPPHGSTARELSVLVDAGMDAGQALRCATAIGACAVGRSTEVGTLEPGKLADFLVVDGDPLRDLAILSDPRRLSVYQAGELTAEAGAIARDVDIWAPLSGLPPFG